MVVGMRSRLSVMMVLVYAVQGAFYPLLAVHLKSIGVPDRERGWIFATLAIGSFVMPMGAGRLVDRYLAAERVMAGIFALSVGFLVVLATGLVVAPWPLFALFLAFWMILAPAYALSSTVALRQLPRPTEQFAGVRLWGTFGWMAVGYLVSLVLTLSGTARGSGGAHESFWVASALALFAAGYCLTLPNTPPLATEERVGGRGGAIREAWELARRPGMPVFLLTAFGVSLTTPFVYQVLPTYLESRGMSRVWVPSALTLGQWSEIATLAALPWLLKRVGPRTTLSLGVGAWALRYAVLALDPPLWLTVAGLPLHGVGIGCFTVAGQLYVDGQAPRDRRAGAQALYMVVTAGIGSFLGCLLAGDVMGRFAGHYAPVFLVPCVIDSALLIYFRAAFRPGAPVQECAGAPNAARPFKNDGVRGPVARRGNLVTESADG